MQTAILLGLVYAFAWAMDNVAGSSFMDRPIVCGALTGLVMGNFEQGLVLSLIHICKSSRKRKKSLRFYLPILALSLIHIYPSCLPELYPAG